MPDKKSQLRDPRILRALQYFEAVGRLASVKLAAEEFGVTASAISHQLRDLTQFLGEDILERQGRGIVLTDTGRRIHAEITTVLGSLDAVIGGVIGPKRPQLRVAVCSSFGPFWLAERLPDFRKRHPGIDLELRLYAEDPLQTEAVADLVVTAEPTSLGFDSVTLFDEMLVAVRSPLEGAGGLGEKPAMITTDILPEDFAKDWTDFLATSGRTRDEFSPDGWIRCSHYLLALGLARAGMGVALVPDFLAAGDLKAGTVIQADRTMMPSGRTYRLCFKAARSSEADLRSVVRWMKSQTPGSVVPFKRRASR